MTREPVWLMGVRKLDIKEFLELGFLQEANRQFFHPLGLALEVTADENGARLTGVWDYRDDEEGILFAPGVCSAENEARVAAERAKHETKRREMFDGEIIQPIT